MARYRLQIKGHEEDILFEAEGDREAFCKARVEVDAFGEDLLQEEWEGLQGFLYAPDGELVYRYIPDTRQSA